MLGAADAGLALAALGDLVEGVLLHPPDVVWEGRDLHQRMQRCRLAERGVTREHCVLVAEEALVGAVARVGGDPRDVEGRDEGGVRGAGRGLAPGLGREAALGAVDAGQALVGVVCGGGEGCPGLGSAVDVVLEGMCCKIVRKMYLPISVSCSDRNLYEADLSSHALFLLNGQGECHKSAMSMLSHAFSRRAKCVAMICCLRYSTESESAFAMDVMGAPTPENIYEYKKYLSEHVEHGRPRGEECVDGV